MLFFKVLIINVILYKELTNERERQREERERERES